MNLCATIGVREKQAEDDRHMTTVIEKKAESKRGITLEELARLGDYVEYLDGEVREKPVAGYLHSLIIMNLIRLISDFVRANKLGKTFGDGLTYVLHQDVQNDARKTRIPDFSFIRQGTLPADFDRTRPIFAAPTLAVEVVSPTESANALQEKLDDYLTYGSEAVWVIYPSLRQLHVYTPNSATIQVYRADETLQAEAFFPGLRIAINDLFLED